MTDAGLDGANDDRSFSGAAFTEHSLGSHDFDRIPKRGTRSVAFQVGDLVRLDATGSQCFANDSLLRWTIRSRETVASPVLVRSTATNQGVNVVAVAFCIRQALQQHDGRPFPAAEAISCSVEGRTPTIWRQHLCLREVHVKIWCQQQVHTSRQHSVGLSGAETDHTKVGCQQSRRTRGVYSESRTLQAQRVRNAACSHRPRNSCSSVAHNATQVVGTRAHERSIVAADSEEHTSATADHGFGRDASVLESLPGNFKKHALLRVHVLSFLRRNAEESGVEAVDVHVREESTAVGEGLSWHVSVLVVQSAVVPAVEGHGGHAVLGAAQVFPEQLRRVTTGRHAEAHSHDSDRLATHGIELVLR